MNTLRRGPVDSMGGGGVCVLGSRLDYWHLADIIATVHTQYALLTPDIGTVAGTRCKGVNNANNYAIMLPFDLRCETAMM